jgi:type VI secretion system secreted protein Hcp
MKTKFLPVRTSIAVLSILLGAAHVDAAPRDSTTNPAQQVFLRVNWGDDSGGAASDGLIEVYGFSHEIDCPVDAASGLPTGKRQHRPFRLEKYIDAASPVLLETHLAKRQIPSVEIVLVRTDRNGNPVPFYTTKLDGVTISGVSIKGQASGAPPMAEEILFVYEKIIWTYLDGGRSITDTWVQP